MRKKFFVICKIAILLILLIGIISTPIWLYRGENIENIRLINTSKIYVGLYLEQTSIKEHTLIDIDETTRKVLYHDSFNKCYVFTNYMKEYIRDMGFIDSLCLKEYNEYKQRYFYEIILLRLKVLAYQGDAEAYHKLFDTYIYDIENNLFTSIRLISLFINDEKHPISCSSELFEIIETSFVGAYDNCKDVTTKFYLLNEIVQFYSNFKECSNKEELYRKELVELIKNNKAVLQETIA